MRSEDVRSILLFLSLTIARSMAAQFIRSFDFIPGLNPSVEGHKSMLSFYLNECKSKDVFYERF